MSSLLTLKANWDIFCKIVDNHGDIGVCWRLAKQLQLEHKLNIRLFIDDLPAAKTIISDLNINLNQQMINGIRVLRWDAKTDFTDVADVAIEAFACELPADYLTAMARKKAALNQETTWVNLEYLSAEPWVADFHAKPSPQPNGLTRYFYFPGFTESTGGLIRESFLTDSNHHAVNQCVFWKNLNLNTHANLKVSLFCYPYAPIEDLLTAMSESGHPVDCYVPESSILPKIAEFFGLSSFSAGNNFKHNNLYLHVLPFLSQADYDQLLSACDINFVRGEDSWLRAIWAGKPFVWQPYFQDENTHIKKLQAFLTLFYQNFHEKNLITQLHLAWSGNSLPQDVWQHYLDQLSDIEDDTFRQSQSLAQQTDLAAKLVIFCNKN